jgi:hypothetical protein
MPANLITQIKRNERLTPQKMTKIAAGINRMSAGVRRPVQVLQETPQTPQPVASDTLVVKCATKNNVDLYGEVSIDEVACVAGDLVACLNQTDPTTNGVYTVVADDDWTGPAQPKVIFVSKGATYANYNFVQLKGTAYIYSTSVLEVAVRVASTANIASLVGLATIDGISLAYGDRVLLKDQDTASQNGVYVIRSDGIAWSKLGQLESVTVMQGTANAKTIWTLNAANTYAQAGGVAEALVKAASTVSLTLSGTQTIDTVACGAGDLVLAKNQSTASQNGVYKVASGSWTKQGQPTFVSVIGGASSVSCYCRFILTAANTYTGQGAFYL